MTATANVIELVGLRPHPQDATDLRWYFTCAQGEMGLRSSFAAMVLKIQCPGPAPSPTLRDLDGRAIAAASREAPIRRALDAMLRYERHHVETLWRAYGNERIPPGLVTAYGEIAGLLPGLASASREYRASRTTRDPVDWLVRLCRPAASARARGIRAELVREAERELLRAARAYHQAKREQRRPRRHG